MCEVCCNPNITIGDHNVQVVSDEIGVDVIPTFLIMGTLNCTGSAEDTVCSCVCSRWKKWRSLPSVLTRSDLSTS